MAAGSSDLNLIPYLDIVVTLTLAMFAMALTESDLYKTDVTAPPTGQGGQPGLSLAISAEGYVLRTEDAAVSMPRDGVWPNERLAGVLRGLRDGGETSPTLTISAAPGIPYEVVIGAMDAARKDTSGPLYPSVSLAVAAH